MTSFDITTTRKQFPALSQPQVYFDNAGGSQTLGTVITAIQKYLSESNVQMGSTYGVGLKSAALNAEGYKAGAAYINSPVDNIVYGPSTTALFRTVSYALSFPAGSEMIVSDIDHEANICSWVEMATRQNLVLKWWTPKTKENPKLLASDLKELMTEKTRLVTLTHASNILGTIHDIKAIANQVHTVPGAMLCVDGVAYAPHRQIDVTDLGVDFYAFSWYKVYGPHIALLYASPFALQELHSLGHFFNPSTTLLDKLGFGSSNYELLASIPSICDYFHSTPNLWAATTSHEHTLCAHLLTNLLTRPSQITILGETDADPAKRVPTVSMTIKGWKSRDFVERVDELSKGEVGIRWGGFYSHRLVAEFFGLGKDGVVRVSMVHYNTVEEIDRLIVIFDEILGKKE